MSRAERIAYLESLSDRLRAKQARERAYLDRRGHNRQTRGGTKTPTDDAYEADQGLEDELLSVLAQLKEIDEKRGQ